MAARRRYAALLLTALLLPLLCYSLLRESSAAPSVRGLSALSESGADVDPGNSSCGVQLQAELDCEEESCSDMSGIFNYLYAYYCGSFHSLHWLSMVLYVLWILFLIVLLGDTADEYFSPTLEAFVVKLKIPPNLAGVTFLSFGNGAPDVFTLVASVLRGNYDLGVGAIVGAGLFVTSVVVGAVVMVSTVKLAKGLFLRDILFYLTAVSMLFGIFLDGKVRLYEALLFLALYLVFVGTAVFNGVRQRLADHSHPATQQPLLAEPEQEATLEDRALSIQRILNHEETSTHLNFDEILDDSYLSKRAVRQHRSLSETPTLGSAIRRNSVSIPKKFPSQSKLSEMATGAGTDLKPLGVPTAPRSLWVVLKDSFLLIFSGSKFLIPLKVVEFPLTVLRVLTIPMVTEDAYSWETNIVVYFLFPLLFAYGAGLPWGYYTFVYVGVGVVLSAVLSFFSPRHTEPKKASLIFPILTIAFVSSVLWVYLIANEAVAILQATGIVWNIPLSILGVTVMAWGNSLGDLVTDTALARQGFASMAIAGTFAGPMFNLLFGMGFGLTVQCIRSSIAPIRDGLSDSALTLIHLSFLFLFFCLLTSLVSAVVNKFTLPRWGAYILFAAYGVFLTLSILLASGTVNFVIKF